MDTLEKDDVVTLLTDINTKLSRAKDLAKDGKVWYSINKIEGLEQKIQYVIIKLNQNENDNNTKNISGLQDIP